MAEISDLSQREQEICKLLLEGKTSKEIAYILKISYGTVNFHRDNLYKKLGINSINELYIKYLPAGGNDAVFDFWFALGDEKSHTMVSRKKEEINGHEESVVTIRGTLNANNMPLSGVYGRPDAKTLEALRAMKSFSFNFLGDGGRYCVSLPTLETSGYDPQTRLNAKDEICGDHWTYVFHTEKDQVSNITITVPDDLARNSLPGEEIEFIRENILFIQIQPVDPGDYCLKFWNIKISA